MEYEIVYCGVHWWVIISGSECFASGPFGDEWQAQNECDRLNGG
jgi:hypothetical protein